MKPERLINSAGSISSCASILGSWQICHNVCLALIFLLSLMGITVVGMPLQFFTTIAVPMWTIAIVLFAITLFFYFSRHCISRNMVIINAGLLIAGIPFQPLQKFSLLFWIVGGILVLSGIVFSLKNRKVKMNWRIKMKQEYIMYGLIGVLIGVIIFNVATILFENNTSVNQPTQLAEIKNSATTAETGFKNINTGTTDEGEVSIALKPNKIIEGKLTVSISANTHSVDLTPFDLKELTTLEFEGKKIKPSSAPKLSGHHASGEFVFEVGKEITAFTIRIKEIPKLEERVFEWK